MSARHNTLLEIMNKTVSPTDVQQNDYGTGRYVYGNKFSPQVMPSGCAFGNTVMTFGEIYCHKYYYFPVSYKLYSVSGMSYELKNDILRIYHFQGSRSHAPYKDMLALSHLESLIHRRTALGKSFFRKTIQPTFCLHHLLPPSCTLELTSKCLSTPYCPVPTNEYSLVHTKRYRSFINFGLAQYQNNYFFPSIII